MLTSNNFITIVGQTEKIRELSKRAFVEIPARHGSMGRLALNRNYMILLTVYTHAIGVREKLECARIYNREGPGQQKRDGEQG